MELIQCKQSVRGLSEDLLTSGIFEATLATDTPLEHLFGRVQLSHEPGAADIPASIPLQIGHNMGTLPVGRITRIKQEGGQTTGTVTLSHNVKATIGRDILDGMITDLSIGASVTDYTESDDGTIIATAWKPIEASLVAVGKDPAAKIHRALSAVKEPVMPTKKTTDPHPTRNADIQALFAGLEGEEWLKLENSALHSDDSIEVIRANVMEQLKARASQPVDTRQTSDFITAGEDSYDKFAEGFSKALALRSDLVDADKRKDAEREYAASEFRGLSLMDVARMYLRAVNYNTAGMDKMQVAGKALHVTRAGIIGHAPGDLSSLLAANVNLALSKGYDEAPETWQVWTGRDSAPDFKQAHRPLLSAFSDLDEIIADGEYTYGTVSDKEERFTIQRFGKLFSIGRSALVNDSLASLARLPRSMGRAAARKVGDEVYNVLANGKTTTMNEDGVALFDAATHGNFVDAGGAIDVASLNTARAAMATQTEPGGHTIRITPRHLITSEASAATAETIVAAAHNPATASGVEPMPGYIGNLNVVTDPRIDADSATKWYLAADASVHDTVLVAFLDGITEPMLEEFDSDPSRDGVIYKVRHEFTTYAGDWRTLYLNDGA